MRVLTYHLHAHTLGPIAEEEELLRHTMDNHLEGIATLDMHLHAVALDIAPQGYPWIAPGNLRDVGRSVKTGKTSTACIVRNRPDGYLHVYLGDFDTIADWLGYKDGEHFDAGVSEDDVKEAQDWFDGITDTEDMIDIASLDREDYISTDENGEEEFDEDLVYYDFSNWWNNMDDIEQVKEYRKHE